MAKPFYVVCKEVRRYFSKQDFNIAYIAPVFGSSEYKEMSESAKANNLALENLLNSKFDSYPVTLCYYNLFEITNLD